MDSPFIFCTLNKTYRLRWAVVNMQNFSHVERLGKSLGKIKV